MPIGYPFDGQYDGIRNRLGMGRGFFPDQIANLKLWLDAADTATITESGTPDFLVSQWNDKSGQENNVFQPTAVNQPLTGPLSISLNGENTILFDGSTSVMDMDVLDTATFTTGNRTIIAVIRVDETVPDGERIGNIFGNFNQTPSTNLETHTAGRLRAFWNNGEVDVFSDAGFDVRDNDGMIVGTVRSDTANTVYFNHALGGTGSAGSATTYAKPFRVGADFGDEPLSPPPVPRIPFNGAIGELMVYDQALSDLDRLRVDTYLANKWGIPLA